MHCSVEPLTLCISLRVIRCGSCLNSIKSAKFSDNFTFKVSSLVRMNSEGKSILEKPFHYHEFSCCSGGFQVCCWDCTCQLCEDIRRTFSLPSIPGSRTVKSIAKISSGLVASRLPICGRILGFGIFARVHRTQYLIQFSTSEYI